MLSCRRLLVKAAVLTTAAWAGAFALQACGPFFPHWLLTDEGGLLEAPTTWFKDAIESVSLPRKPGPRPPQLKAVVDRERSPYRQTADADLADVQAATSNRSLSAAYTEVREALARYGEEVAAWQEEAAWNPEPPPRPEPPELTAPVGLPGEIQGYMRGALAYHRGDFAEARAAWEELLARPASQRRLRSVWAAFMLGKASLRENPADPEAAIGWFERTRELASRDLLPDPLGLAASSLGWQARAEMSLQRPDRALELYYDQMKAGDPSAITSLRLTSAKLLKDPKALKAVAGSEQARPIMTAYVLSRWDRVDYEGPLDPTPARQWLEAIQAAEVQNVDKADWLAWIAYRAGDFKAAEEWLRRSRGPMSDWIQAKLLLRAGKLAEAERLLAVSGSTLPPAPGADGDPFMAYENKVQPALRPRLRGEQGAAQLAKSDYTGAVSSLLYGGYWSDAAYVAERVLSTEELRTWVDRAWPPALASHRPDDYGDGWTFIYGGIVSPSKDRTAYSLRYLLGRRLAREGRYGEAESYLPKPLGLPLKTLARSIAEGHDVQRPAGERARALFRAACVSRHQGMEILGTELEPDWFIYEGQYENVSYAETRVAGTFQILGPTQDERARADRTRVEPWKRFHYRYKGAEIAREAAGLLPDGSEEKARILATAGNWLEGRDPEAARPFLETLLSCCGETVLGRQARRANAIPNIGDPCEAGTKPQLQ